MVLKALIAFIDRQGASEALAAFARVLSDCNKDEIASTFERYSKEIKTASYCEVAEIIRSIREVYQRGYGGPLDFYPGIDTPERQLLSARFILAEKAVRRYIGFSGLLHRQMTTEEHIGVLKNHPDVIDSSMRVNQQQVNVAGTRVALIGLTFSFKLKMGKVSILNTSPLAQREGYLTLSALGLTILMQACLF
ncbi:MAG: hypothetical protein Q4P06_09150 [Actinomycetaceae bacterium]|nr:hypothetical protein [Actinomycetaceae bacterium]